MELTTLEMIEQIEEGSVATCVTGKVFASRVMKKTHFGVPGTLVWVEEGSHGTDKPFMINTYTLQHKWKIEREYVPFEKAIEAYKEGKGIVCHVEERKFRYKKGENLYSSMYLDEIILGQWVIEQ